jgi:hypothetical protein
MPYLKIGKAVFETIPEALILKATLHAAAHLLEPPAIIRSRSARSPDIYRSERFA